MGMQFTIGLQGDIAVDAEASDLGLDLDNGNQNEWFDLPSRFDVSDSSVHGTVTINARVSLSGVEVSASDMADFDVDVALQEQVNEVSYSSISVESADFEVEEEPTGFTIVMEALGYDRDEAIKVYAALDSNGHEVI